MLASVTKNLKSLGRKMPLAKAACVIIGDEVLNGKITDTNSRFFAKYCYGLGVQLKEIVTIGDEHEQIISTIKRLKEENDMIFTSGGIGPTHDDMTYESIASSFGLECKLDKECQARMHKISDPESRHEGDALKAFYRMATLPCGPDVKNHYVYEDMWVPIVSIQKKVFILPGVPQLFEKLLEGFAPTLKKLYGLERDTAHDYQRYFVKTPLSESEISSFLGKLQQRGTKVSKEIKIGSYPHFGSGFNTVSILGLKKDDVFLQEIVEETISKLKGTKISEAEEQKISDSR